MLFLGLQLCYHRDNLSTPVVIFSPSSNSGVMGCPVMINFGSQLIIFGQIERFSCSPWMDSMSLSEEGVEVCLGRLCGLVSGGGSNCSDFCSVRWTAWLGWEGGLIFLLFSAFRWTTCVHE